MDASRRDHLPVLTSRWILATTPRTTLVLLPSLGTTSRVWSGALAALPCTEDVDVLLVELPGHGGSPGRDRVTIAGLADALLDVLSGSRTTTAVVAGVSMGGALALETAALGADRIIGVVMASSALRFGSPDGWASMIAEVERTGTAAPDPERTREGWFTRGYRDGEGARAVSETLEDLAAVDPASYIACCRALAEYDGWPALDSLTVPLLAVGGAADRALPPDDLRRASQTRAQVHYAELPGAHLAVRENADAAAFLLDGFLREVLPLPTPSSPRPPTEQT